MGFDIASANFGPMVALDEIPVGHPKTLGFILWGQGIPIHKSYIDMFGHSGCCVTLPDFWLIGSIQHGACVLATAGQRRSFSEEHDGGVSTIT